MSILGNIFAKLLGHHPGAPAATGPAAPPASSPATAPAAATPAPSAPVTAAPAAAARMDEVDVAKILDELAANNAQKLDWRHSIVDMMKLLGMESSLGERKELAKELGYTGDANDSAKMNVWLHGQVFQKLAANGGKVPADLLR